MKIPKEDLRTIGWIDGIKVNGLIPKSLDTYSHSDARV
jgi:hypothetical protein